MSELRVTKWQGTQPATAVSIVSIQRLLREEGLSAYTWQNGPYDTYDAHTHPYDKVIYVLSGSITFGLPERGDSIPLAAGDRLDLRRGVRHDAQVGPDGVVCLEAHLP